MIFSQFISLPVKRHLHDKSAVPAASPAAMEASGPAVAAAPGAGPSGFIRVQGGTFVDDNCDEFLLIGWNRCAALVAGYIAVLH